MIKIKVGSKEYQVKWEYRTAIITNAFGKEVERQLTDCILYTRLDAEEEGQKPPLTEIGKVTAIFNPNDVRRNQYGELESLYSQERGRIKSFGKIIKTYFNDLTKKQKHQLWGEYFLRAHKQVINKTETGVKSVLKKILEDLKSGKAQAKVTHIDLGTIGKKSEGLDKDQSSNQEWDY